MRTQDDIRKDIQEVQNEIDKQFWIFTRSAVGKPPDSLLYKEREKLENELKESWKWDNTGEL